MVIKYTVQIINCMFALFYVLRTGVERKEQITFEIKIFKNRLNITNLTVKNKKPPSLKCAKWRVCGHQIEYIRNILFFKINSVILGSAALTENYEIVDGRGFKYGKQ